MYLQTGFYATLPKSKAISASIMRLGFFLNSAYNWLLSQKFLRIIFFQNLIGLMIKKLKRKSNISMSENMNMSSPTIVT